jgi:hypothetical protein
VDTSDPSGHIDGIVVSSHQALGTKIAHLLAGLAGDVVGEDYLQPPPEAGICVEEGLAEVRPYRIAAEAGAAEIVPGCLSDVTLESRAGTVSITSPASVSSTGRSRLNRTRRRGEAAERRALDEEVGFAPALLFRTPVLPFLTLRPRAHRSLSTRR